jgi:hypothetical protein
MFKEDDSIQPFTGSIDALLEQSMMLDPDAIDLQVEEEKYNMSMLEIMRMFDCTYQEAEYLFNEAKTQMLKEEIEQLISEGKVKIVGTDENGDTLYASA